MSLQARLTLLSAGAVAVAVVAAAVTAWFLVRAAMLHDVDSRLLDQGARTEQIAQLSDRLLPAFGALPARRLVSLVQNDPVGVLVQAPDGSLQSEVTYGPLADRIGALDWLPPPPSSGTASRLDTVSSGGTTYRILSARTGDGAVVRIVQPLAQQEETLARVGWALGVTAAGGVGLAALLGWIVSRSGLRPVDRLVRVAEDVARTQDLGHRVDVGAGRPDEVGRLTDAMNRMLSALDDARRAQRELVENTAHELRTPLTVLRNDLGLLARTEEGRALPAGERRQLVADLDGQVTVLADAVGEIVDLARGQAGAEPARRTDLVALIGRAVERTRRVAPGVEVRTQVPDHGVVVVHPAVLERAVANLVRNALQASPDGGVVTVTLDLAHDTCRVRVLDRGHGLADDEVPRVFDRFFRGAAARERPGSGLGLAIVAQAAELHGGTAEAARRPGGGAAFTLRWPRRPALPAPS